MNLSILNGATSPMNRFARASLLAFLALGSIVSATAAETISLTPSAGSVPVGETCTVTVNLAGATPFANWAQQLNWDPAALEMTAQAGGTFTTFVADSNSLPAINAAGSVHAGGFGMANNSGGSGSLGVFTFKVLQAGPIQVTAVAKGPSTPFGFEMSAADGSNVRVPTLPGALTITGTLVLPTVTIAASDAAAAEVTSGAANGGLVTLTRSGATTAPLTVSLAISGTATNGTDYVSIPSTATIATGSATATIAVDVSDDAAVEGSETVIISLASDTGYTIGTSSSATVTIADNDAAPAVGITASVAAAAESAVASTNGEFTLTRSGSTAAALTVNLGISGTATAGTDYTAIPATANFAAGSATAIVPVTVIDDLVTEGAETVIISFASGTGYTIGTSSSATVTIADNDAAPAVNITASNAAAAEGVVASTNGEFTLTRSGSTAAALTVNLGISGSATAGTDYTAIPATASFAAGSATAIVPVTIIDDLVTESSETVIISLASGTGYTIGTSSSATVTIADNDAAPAVGITASVAAAAESATAPTHGAFTLTRSGSTAAALTVHFSVSGSATAGTDYTAIPATASFAAGSAAVIVPVTVIDDLVTEGAETVIISLASGTGYTLGTSSSATVTIADNDGGSTTPIASSDSDGGGRKCGIGGGVLGIITGLCSLFLRRRR
jgi:hypothetical protein